MTMTTSGLPGHHDIASKPMVPIDTNPPRTYHGPRKPYARLGAAEPGQLRCLPEGVSVGCSTEDDPEEELYNPTHYRGPRKSYRGRGRGGHDGWRGGPRRRPDAGMGFSHGQYGPSYVGQSWGRGY